MLGLQNEEDVKSAIDVANCIQGAIPAGKNGGEVMAAMAMLIAVNMRDHVPVEHQESVLAEIAEMIDNILAGRIDVRFVSHN